jgi:hypothetical protein
MKIGFDQINNPAPLSYQRAVNGLIMLQVPLNGLFGTLNGQHIMSDKATIITIGVIGTLTGILKAFQYFIGAEPVQTITTADGNTQSPK